MSQTLHRGVMSDQDHTWREVLRHIERVLNTRCGQAPSAPNYGVVGGGENLAGLLKLLPLRQNEIERLLVHTIGVHEPRLTQLRLQVPSWVSGQAMRLRFNAVHHAGNATDVVSFTVMVTALGRCTVQPV